MVLGEKLYEENGNVTSTKITRVHPIEGVITELSFISDIRGEGKFPNGQKVGSGVMTQYSHGTIDASWQGIFMTTNTEDQFMWWAHEKSKVIEGGKIKGLIIVTGFTNSQELSWMNDLITVLELDTSISSQKFKITGYEWKIE